MGVGVGGVWVCGRGEGGFVNNAQVGGQSSMSGGRVLPLTI